MAETPETIGKKQTALLHSKSTFPHTESEIMQSIFRAAKNLKVTF